MVNKVYTVTHHINHSSKLPRQVPRERACEESVLLFPSFSFLAFSLFSLGIFPGYRETYCGSSRQTEKSMLEIYMRFYRISHIQRRTTETLSS